MIIVHFSIMDWEKELILKALPKHKHFFYESDDVEEKIEEIKNCEILDVFIYSHVDKRIIDTLSNLKSIMTRSTGFDHIDIDYSKSKGITVCNVPSYGSVTVAEHTFALILAIAKNLFATLERTQKLDFHFRDLMGFDLEGKTIGIIGAGRIGRQVITIARGFGMNVIAHDIYQDEEFAKQLNYRYVELDELLSQSDIISLHTPANDYTCSLLLRPNIKKIKTGAVFINTSRGCLIQNEDLLYALDNGIISAAGLDAIDGENHMFHGDLEHSQKHLLMHKNVLYTPHSAFFTKEAVTRILNTTIENIKGFETNVLQNTV